MSSEEQWRDAYGIAEKMYREDRSKKRTELDIYSQLVCARYDSIFCYDPYADKYSFRNQALTFEEPVPSKCRPIADIDLERIKKNTLNAELNEPVYMNLTPLHVVPPSTLLVFNYSLPRAFGLTNALEEVSPTLITRPTETDIQPGAEFLYKHKDQKCYRVILLAEVTDSPVPDSERRYKVIFMDVCQVITLKLKNLYLPVEELSLARFPCVLQCARLVGVKMMRSGYIPKYAEEIRRLYADKALRKTGISALVYTTDKKEQKLIVDFPSFAGNECTEAAALVAVHGHQSPADRDPIPLSYQLLINKTLLPLQYNHPDDEDEFDDDEFVNLSDISSIHLEAAKPPVEAATLAQHTVENQEDGTQAPPNSLKELSIYESMDETIASFRSISAAATPMPTFDDAARGDSTPTLVANKTGSGEQKMSEEDGLVDGWGDEKPQTVQRQVDTSKIVLLEPLSGAQSKKFGSPQKSGPSSPLKAALECSMNSSVDMDMSAVERSLRMPEKITNNHLDVILNHRSTSSTSTPVISNDASVIAKKQAIISIENDHNDQSVTLPRVETPDPVEDIWQVVMEKDTTSHRTPTKQESPRRRKHGSSAAGSAAKSIRVADMNDNVFEEHEELLEMTLPVEVQKVKLSPNPSPKVASPQGSTSSATALLMHDAQENFEDEDDGWGEPKEEVKKTDEVLKEVVQKEGKQDETVDDQENQKSFDEKTIREALSEALKKHKEMKMESLKERIREHFRSCAPSRATSVSVPEDIEVPEPEVKDDVSVKSICPTASDTSEHVLVDDLIVEFANVPEALKQLADAFMSSIQDAALNKNRSTFVCDIFGLQLIAIKSTGDLEQRFWKQKIDEAKGLEPAFD